MKVEPVRFEEAKKSHVETMELVSTNTTTRFFNLAKAQTNLKNYKAQLRTSRYFVHFCKRQTQYRDDKRKRFAPLA